MVVAAGAAGGVAAPAAAARPSGCRPGARQPAAQLSGRAVVGQPCDSSTMMAAAVAPISVLVGTWQQRRLRRRQRLTCRSSDGSGREGMPEEDQSIKVKCMLAEGSGRLDLSECELAAVPPAVFDIPGLEELSLAGNRLAALPAEVGALSCLSRLQLAGNCLPDLPPALCQLAALQGLWLHGNLLQRLPEQLGSLAALTQLSLSGNRLRALPPSVGSLAQLQELSAAGNQLQALPSSLAGLASLAKLHLHGNQLRELPASISGLTRLQELSLHGNPDLALLPEQLGALPALRDLSAADCGLVALPASLATAPELQTLSLYGNQLCHLPPALLQAPRLKTVWLEGNPLAPEAVEALLQVLPSSSVTALGLDERQLAQLPRQRREALAAAAGPKLRVSRIVGAHTVAAAAGGGGGGNGASASSSGAGSSSGGSSGSSGSSSGGSPGGVGYFKLEPAPAEASQAASGSSRPSTEVLVVSFGSAPGTPNWGGLLRKVRAAATAPQEQNFDVLYVVDPHRSWYRGGDDGFKAYEARLAAACAPYRHVIFIGDSMGATGALLFARLATEVHAWTPQVDLATSSIRPGEGPEWQAVLRRRVLEGVAACHGSIVVHTGSWRHDLDQARCLPARPGLKVQIYSVESHRLALALDRRGALVQIVRSAVLQAMGLTNKDGLRLANLY